MHAPSIRGGGVCCWGGCCSAGGGVVVRGGGVCCSGGRGLLFGVFLEGGGGCCSRGRGGSARPRSRSRAWTNTTGCPLGRRQASRRLTGRSSQGRGGERARHPLRSVTARHVRHLAWSHVSKLAHVRALCSVRTFANMLASSRTRALRRSCANIAATLACHSRRRDNRDSLHSICQRMSGSNERGKPNIAFAMKQASCPCIFAGYPFWELGWFRGTRGPFSCAALTLCLPMAPAFLVIFLVPVLGRAAFRENKGCVLASQFETAQQLAEPELVVTCGASLSFPMAPTFLHCFFGHPF